MKKIFLLPLCFFYFTFSSFASSENEAKIDSLKIVVSKAKDDTSKVNSLNELSYNFQYVDPDEGLKFAQQALTLSEKLNWKAGLAHSNKHIGINYFRKSENALALTYFKTCLEQYRELNLKIGIAKSLGNVGNVYLVQSEYPKALEYYLDEIKILEELNEKPDLAGILGNIGIIYFNLLEYPKALDYYTQSLKINEELGNKSGAALTLGNIGGVYAAQLNYDKALDCYLQSLSIFEVLGNKNGVARNYSNIAIVFKTRGDFKKAIDYYKMALVICEEIGNKYGAGVNLNNIGNVYLTVAKDSSKADLNAMFNGNKTQCLQMAKAYVDSGLVLIAEVGDLNLLSAGYSVQSEVLTMLGDFDGALESYKLHTTYKDSIFNLEKDKKLTQTSMQYEFDKKEAATKAEQEKKDIQQKNIRNSLSAAFFGALIFSVVVFRQRNKISKARKRSDELLLNILPEEVAEELKTKGNAEAKQFDEVTVLFTDFKGFTSLSETLTPKELVRDLHECFTEFDNIMRKHGLEKIKTIGDSYMAVCGLPSPNINHAINAVNAALEIVDFIEHGKAKKIANGQPFFEVRIGLHTGPVVAGIVGVKKFAYDIWGDTVNTASRMESSGEAGKVNISETTYELVKNDFNCNYRGMLTAKGKGEMKMFFVERNS